MTRNEKLEPCWLMKAGKLSTTRLSIDDDGASVGGVVGDAVNSVGFAVGRAVGDAVGLVGDADGGWVGGSVVCVGDVVGACVGDSTTPRNSSEDTMRLSHTNPTMGWLAS